MTRTFTTPIISYRVIDGDSIEMLLDAGYHVRVEVTGRLSGIDAPERNTAAGKAVAAWVERWLAERTELHWQSESLDKYGRSLGNVTIDNGAYVESLCWDMLSQHLCRAYSGDARQPWTAEELDAIAERAK